MSHTGIFIGRFQPFHQGHLFIIEQALGQCEQLLLMVGSANRARSAKNPFTAEERIKLIQKNLSAWDPEKAKKVTCIATDDYPYDEPGWIAAIKAAVTQHAGNNSLAVVGHDKDVSTYYLQHFPEWKRIEFPDHKKISATQIRTDFFAGKKPEGLPGITEVSARFLKAFAATALFKILREEHDFITRYKASWANTPYPPIFVTTDSVVICDGHILLIKRGQNPGKGLWSLPGGFVENNEWVIQGLIRELQEETSLELEQPALLDALQRLQTFDRPDRSQIGRVITHAALFVLPGNRPKVKANDDAADAKWLPLKKFGDMTRLMHDDHYFIVQELAQEMLA